MTESEWMECKDPTTMVTFLARMKLHKTKSGSRKAQLLVRAGERAAPFFRDFGPDSLPERIARSGLIREIFGNPFRPISINPTLLNPTILNLAQAAYDERIMPAGELDPARLAVLSDALEEAGCDDADILSHLRGTGPHVRGCWALDLLLGKE